MPCGKGQTMTQSEWTTRCRSAQGGDTGSRFVCTRRGIVVLLAMLGAASVAEAQVAGSLDELLQSGEQLQPGDEIFVTDVSGRRIRTRISDVSAIALSVTEGRNTRTLRDTDVRKIERRDSLVNGSLVGVGISIAALWGSCELGQSECYGEAYQPVVKPRVAPRTGRNNAAPGQYKARRGSKLGHL